MTSGLLRLRRLEHFQFNRGTRVERSPSCHAGPVRFCCSWRHDQSNLRESKRSARRTDKGGSSLRARHLSSTSTLRFERETAAYVESCRPVAHQLARCHTTNACNYTLHLFLEELTKSPPSASCRVSRSRFAVTQSTEEF